MIYFYDEVIDSSIHTIKNLSYDLYNTMALLEATNISYAIWWKVLIKNLSMRIDKKQIVSIIGYNWSWKSTLLKLLLWSIQPVQWTVTRKQWVRVWYVPQKLSFTQQLPITVNDFIKIYTWKNIAWLDEECSQINIQELADRPLNGLSWGQLQKVLIYNALVWKPDILFLDEPTSWLDIRAQKDFYALIDHIHNHHGTSIVLVSHDIHTVYSKSDTIICLHKWVCCSGSPKDSDFSSQMHQLLGGYVVPYLHSHHHDW
jgi:zinc transport system ATP-binding protein